MIRIANIELTNACPFTCVMCARTHAMTRQIGHMTVDTFKNCVGAMIDMMPENFRRNMRRFSPFPVNLHHFGESLINPNVKEILEMLKYVPVYSRMSVNPQMLLNHEKMEAVCSGGLSEIQFTLDGYNQKQYRETRGKFADYEKAIHGIELLLDFKKRHNLEKPYIMLQMIELPDRSTKQFLERWDGFEGIKAVRSKKFQTWDGSVSEVNALVKEQPELDHTKTCSFPWDSVVILWDGRVVPCCYDYDGKYVMGNVNETPIMEIWNGERAISLRRQHHERDLSDNPLCKNCIEYKRVHPVEDV